MILGNDISKWQGEINFDVYKNNANFLIFKASEGTGYIDTQFIRNQRECRRVGLPIGYYHFARPDLGNSAVAEADWFLKVCGTPVESEVYVLDYEANWSGDVVGWCKSFLDRVQEKIGVKCLIYLNQSQVDMNWQPVVDAGYALWIAAYTGSPTNNTYKKGKWASAAMQQWTNSQNVPGITGVIDGDVFFGTVDQFKKYGYKAPVIIEPPTTPPPTPECPPDLSGEVESLKKEVSDLKISAVGLNNKITDLETQLATCKSNAIPGGSSEVLQRVKDIIWGKGFWWTKINSLKVLLPR